VCRARSGIFAEASLFRQADVQFASYATEVRLWPLADSVQFPRHPRTRERSDTRSGIQREKRRRLDIASSTSLTLDPRPSTRLRFALATRVPRAGRQRSEPRSVEDDEGGSLAWLHAVRICACAARCLDPGLRRDDGGEACAALTEFRVGGPKTYPRSRPRPHTSPHLATLTKGMSSCRETCVVKSMRGRAEKSVCRGFAACRARASQEAAR